MSAVKVVVWRKRVSKQLEMLPDHIVLKFYAWVEAVRLAGLSQVRMQPGFHDEPLKGKRKGQRSIRLNAAYRAVYEERKDGSIKLIEVIEVNKHEY